ncbi:MAG: flavodoxin family protein [Candidatus Methanomethylophilaceae archaeon]
MKRLLIVNGSPRRDGADSVICGAVSELAKRFGYESETVFVDDLGIKGCQACMRCKKDGICAQDDAMNGMISRIKGSDMLLLAMPVYFGAESSQMKTFVDRLYPLYKGPEAAPDMGALRKACVIVTCGAPDGNMTYGCIVSRYMHTMKSLGITDVSGAVIPGADPANVLEKEFVKDLLDSIEFQLEM